MPVSLFDLFKIGVGPSSSHTMGPMTAACLFAEMLGDRGEPSRVRRIEVRLHGSLALTGRGHATDTAIITGLHGIRPDAVDPDEAAAIISRTRAEGMLRLGGKVAIAFDEARDICWHGHDILPFHTNAVQFLAFQDDKTAFFSRCYYSIGGGFVVDEDQARANRRSVDETAEPYPYVSAAELLAFAERDGISIAEVALANEDSRRPRAETEAGIARILAAMDGCIERGLASSGMLPGGLGVQRRAAKLLRELHARMERNLADPLAVLDLVQLWSLAVNEENAAGGKVVTAPTNGAAGVIPAVLRFIERAHGASPVTKANFLLTAGAIGALYKRNASISAAEVGCQGEVGVACSMAAAGLAAVLGGTNAQIENAAEIGMEHNLGLTCDPIGGLVQIPCIERNAIGAVKAIGAARLALSGDGTHHVSLDHVIETMRRTGHDMSAQYKETAQGGLAVCVPAC